MKRNLTLDLISAVFIFLFIYTALSKLLSFSSFKYTLHQLPLIGFFGTVIAVLLPLSELLVAVLLFIPLTRRTGMWASLMLMLVFTLYIACAIMLGSGLPCSCGGVFQSLTWQQHLWVNLLLIFLALIAVRIQTKLRQTKSNFSLQ
ncbi:MAG TPA: MauE/DoxX family redox-associated membrane protein [Flavisolibacter sp.]|nr:MauE/DoxX family redox-associated membrane protein [Flavisolibacter sp.]